MQEKHTKYVATCAAGKTTVIMSYNNIIDIHVALPPVTEMLTIVSVCKTSLEGVVVITTGTVTRSAVVSFTLSGVVCPKLNRKVCAADKSNVKKHTQ